MARLLEMTGFLKNLQNMHLTILKNNRWKFTTAHLIQEMLQKALKPWLNTKFKNKSYKNEVSNYQGILFCKTIRKIFTNMLLDKLGSWTDSHKILQEFQAGFHKTYSTIDNIFTLTSIIKIKCNVKK